MSIIDRARALRAVIEANAQTMTDTAALEVPELFPVWDERGMLYKAGQRVRYNGTLHKVLQDHTSQHGWTPAAAPSLFAKVLTDPIGAAILPWEQPNSTNPYMKGDKVTHNGSMWVSLIDNNVWEPGVYGWEEM